MNRITFALLSILVLAASTPVSAAQRADAIVVGGLFSLSGDGATLGKASQSALELAARDINAVREVWIWTKEALKAYELRGNAYLEISQSVVIPGLTPSFIRGFLDCETQTEAVRKMRAALRTYGSSAQLSSRAAQTAKDPLPTCAALAICRDSSPSIRLGMT